MTNRYQNPLITRYASVEMQENFSAQAKFSTWRSCWVALAEAEMELGLNITPTQVQQLKAAVNDIDFERAKAIEKETRHDVMSHVHCYGEQVPEAKAIIHLGATSAFVGGNTDLILMHKALTIIENKLVALLSNLSDFGLKYKDLPCLAYTHFQPAQPTTVGKRAGLWLQDFYLDYQDLKYILDNYYLRGCKGTTGTQASYLELFDNDHQKVEELDKRVCQKLGFEHSIPLSGQTYSRKIDSKILALLSAIAQSAHKMTNDIRLLQNLKEIEEPFEKNQIGSSAMAYKRNPMRSERIASLSRLVFSLSLNPVMTTATQWFERTLDDSANRRISLPEAFLAVDAILEIAINITSSLVVYPKVIRKNLMRELPFMATENILMTAVKAGGDRQELHEAIRQHSMAASKVIKEEGGDNDLLERIATDSRFNITLSELKETLQPELYTGRASQQITNFVQTYIQPILAEYPNLQTKIELEV